MSVANEIKIDLAEQFQQLPHAPIVEAIIEVRTRAEAPLEEASMRSQLESKLPGYHFLDSQRAFQHELKMEPGQQPQQNLRDLGWRRMRFQSADQLHIVQFNRDGFVFSRLRPYERWAQFRSEGMRLWLLYSELVRPTEVQRLGLRFINRIELPPQELRFEEYIEPAPKPPKTLDLPFRAFLDHDTLAVPGHPYAINVIRTIQHPQSPGTEWIAVILDIDVFTLQAFEHNQNVLEQRLAEMRWLKNKAFFGSITQKALAIFQQ